MTTPTLTPRGYVLDGQTLPRVSSILGTVHKDAIWTAKLNLAAETGDPHAADKAWAPARDLGTAIHQATEAWDRDGELPTDGALLPYVDAYRTWRPTVVAEVVAIEQTVWSSQLRVAGTLDRLYRLHDHRLVLADIKSGKTVDGTTRLQTAAYVGMLHEMDGTMIDGRLVIHLPSSSPGTINILEYDKYEHDWLIFRALCAFYWWHDAHKDDWRVSNGV